MDEMFIFVCENEKGLLSNILRSYQIILLMYISELFSLISEPSKLCNKERNNWYPDREAYAGYCNTKISFPFFASQYFFLISYTYCRGLRSKS